MKNSHHVSTEDAATKLRHEHDAEAAGSGALVGAAMGAIGGPIGIVAGALLGGIAAGISAEAVQEDTVRENRENEKLDEEIGVIGGDLGAPNLKHPPAARGTYSAASAGSHTPSLTPAEGPMSAPQDNEEEE